MKRNDHRLMFALLLLFITLGTLTSAFAQLTPSQDSYTNTAKATTNFGTATTLGVVSSAASIQTTYIKFDLSSVPAGYTSVNVAKATLKLYVNSVTTAGSFNVDFVNGAWAEKTITYDLVPALGTTIASSVPLTTANAGNYIQIDVTSALEAWLNGSQPNDGLALVANSPLAATFDSKENSTQSHPAELDIVLIPLPNTCSANQTLQWNGSVWACASAGTGTVTSVGLSAPASDFTVSNSPITGSGTLTFNWNLPPTSGDTANAIVKRDASGNAAVHNLSATDVFASDVDTVTVVANTVQANSAAMNGSVVAAYNTSTSGSTSYGIYGETDSNTSGAAGMFGIATSTTAANTGVVGQTSSTLDTSSGILGLATGTSGHTYGVEGSNASPDGAGVFGLDVAPSNTGSFYLNSFVGMGVWGDTGNSPSPYNNYGVLGTADDNVAGRFENNSPSSATTLVVTADNANSRPFEAYNSATGLGCNVDAAGNLNCAGAKHAVVPIDGGQRRVALAAIESPKNWFEDFGSAKVMNGAAVVALEPEFAQTVNTEMEYNVFLTPYGDCKGLYVSNRTATSFEVHELGGGAATVNFGYRIVALRKNFENIRMEDHTKDFDAKKLARDLKGSTSGPRIDMKRRMPLLRAAPMMHPIAQKKTH